MGTRTSDLILKRKPIHDVKNLLTRYQMALLGSNIAAIQLKFPKGGLIFNKVISLSEV